MKSTTLVSVSLANGENLSSIMCHVAAGMKRVCDGSSAIAS